MFSSIIIYLFLLCISQSNTVLRPNVYFGTRSDVKDSHLSGIMWFEGSRLDSIRHECRREDDIKNWGWKEFDASGYGKQTLRDIHNYLKLEMNYTKNGDNWIIQIDGKRIRKEKQKRNVTLIFYYGVTDKNSYISYPSISHKQRKRGLSNPIDFTFKTDDTSVNHIAIEEEKTNTSPMNLNHPYSALHIQSTILNDDDCLQNSFWYGRHMKKHNNWRFPNLVKQVLQEGINQLYSDWNQRIQSYGQSHPGQSLPSITRKQLTRAFQPLLPNTIESNSNFIAIQRVMQLPFTVRIYVDTIEEEKGSLWNEVKENIFGKPTQIRGQRYSKEELDDQFKKQSVMSLSFIDQFNHVFDISSYSDDYQKIARAGISNLLGGVSYFFGTTIQRTKEGKQRYTKEGMLLSAIPGRSYFPRGFLWDEGFHELIINEWNHTLSEAVLTSWFNRMEDSGYIEREQILGDEARAQVPKEFIPQDPNIVNPPTFVLVIEKMLKSYSTLSNEVEIDSEGNMKSSSSHFLSTLLPKVWKWIQYMIKSQKSILSTYSYRWYGRTNQHCLASGLDDFPRHSILSEKESHVDLVSWIVYACKVVEESAIILHYPTIAEEARSIYSPLQHSLLTDHWDDKAHCFSDIGVIKREYDYDQDQDQDQDQNQNSNPNPNPNPNPTNPKFKEIIGFEPHIGYPSILPFALMLMDSDDKRIFDILDILEDPNQMWSNYGLRSLSKRDSFYGIDENYWRGNVWININYLVLRALHEKYNKEGIATERCQKLYSSLRKNIVNNVMEQYKKTGFYWENYNSETGEGNGVHPFNGWSTLVVLIMSETY